MICAENGAGRTTVADRQSDSQYTEKITRQPALITHDSCVFAFDLVFLVPLHNRCRLDFSYQFPIALLPL